MYTFLDETYKTFFHRQVPIRYLKPYPVSRALGYLIE